MPTPEELANLSHEDTVLFAKFNLQGSLIITGGMDNKAKIWSAAIEQESAHIVQMQNIKSVDVSQSGMIVVTENDDNIARALDINSQQEITHLQHSDSVSTAIFSPDGSIVASRDIHGIWIWNPISGRKITRIEYPNLVNLEFSPNGKLLVTAVRAGDAFIVWDTFTGEKLQI